MQTELRDERSAQPESAGTPQGAAADAPSSASPHASLSWWGRLVRRRHYWVNWRSQLPATTLSVCATLFFVVMFNWAMFEKTSARRAVIAEVRPLVEQQLLAQDKSFHSFLIVLSVAFIVCLVAGMVVFTHRSAGPVHRVRAHIRRVTEGDLDCPVVLRKKDHFKELADDFNQMLDSLDRRDRHDAQKLEALALRLQTSSTEADAVSEVLIGMARMKAPATNA